MIDSKTLRRLVGRAHDCTAAALVSIDEGRPEHAETSIRAAYDILGYIEAKQALARGATVDALTREFPRHD